MRNSPHSPNLSGSGLLNAREAARWLGVSERQLDRLKADHGLPFVRLGSRSVRYRRESLEAWAKAQEQHAAR